MGGVPPDGRLRQGARGDRARGDDAGGSRILRPGPLLRPRRLYCGPDGELPWRDGCDRAGHPRGCGLGSDRLCVRSPAGVIGEAILTNEIRVEYLGTSVARVLHVTYVL